MWNILVVLILLTSFDFFRVTPFWDYQTLLRLLLSIYGILYLIKNWQKTDPQIKKWVVIFYLFALYLIIPSSLNLNQSFKDTVIANVSLFSICSSITLYIILKRKKIKLDIEKIFLLLIWVDFIVLIFLSITNTTIVYTSIFTGSSVESEPFKLCNSFIIFGVLYYFVSYMKKGNFYHLLLSLTLFFIPFIFKFQRMQLIFTLIVIFSFVYLVSKKSRLNLLLKIAIIFIVLFVSSLFISEKYIDDNIINLSDALNLFNPKAYISDVSTLARVGQIDFAFEKISENPFWGNGIVRTVNKEKIFGNFYFFYDDIGLIGLIYIGGFFGLLLYLYQVFDSVKRIRIKQILDNSVFDNAVILYLLFIVLSSFMTGTTFYTPYHFLTVLIIIICRQQAKIQIQL